MKFVWVASINRYRRTETEVKKERLKYEVVEFETDKDSLIDRFNAYEERIEALQAQLSGGASPAVVETPETTQGQSPDLAQKLDPPPPTAPKTDEAELRRRLAQQVRGMEADEIEERIEESKGPHFARFLIAGITRLGELGPEGWDHMKAFLDRDYKRPGTVDRGLRYLSLAQIAELDGKGIPQA